MVKAMPAPKGGIWVDIGGGTGSNLEYFGEKLQHWEKVSSNSYNGLFYCLIGTLDEQVVVLDLCPSLLETAKKRVAEHQWEGLVDVVHGDACDFDCECDDV